MINLPTEEELRRELRSQYDSIAAHHDSLES